MATKTKIFISSSAQDELKPLRAKTFVYLRDNLGHDPKMYEENLGPWPKDFIKNCLEAVRECEIFLLYISNKAGSYLLKEDKTVTHLEFLEAYHNQKEIIVFVEPQISQFFLAYIREPLSKLVNEYRITYRRNPSFFECVKKVLPTITVDIPVDVEDYTWAFLFDIVEKQKWLEKLLNDEDHFIEILGEYLSDVLRRGTQFTPIEEEIIENAILAKEYRKYQRFTYDLTELIKNGKIIKWEKFLRILRRSMKGGEISEKRGYYSGPKIGEFYDCEGITVYKKNGLKMERLASDGIAGGNEIYFLDQDRGTSFVVDGYIEKLEETLFYREDKNLVYLTSRLNDFILCFHFALDEDWDKINAKAFHNELLSDILNAQANVVFLKFAKMVLGGLNNES